MLQLGKSLDFGAGQPWIQILELSFNSYVILDKIFNLFNNQFPYL